MPHGRGPGATLPSEHHAERDRPAALLEMLLDAARPLLRPLRLTGELSRGALRNALLVATAVLVIARTMDLMIFSAVPGRAPYFFAPIAAVPLLAALPSMAVRRLRDTGRRGSALLLVLVPVLGWLVLAWLLCRPTRATASQGEGA